MHLHSQVHVFWKVNSKPGIGTRQASQKQDYPVDQKTWLLNNCPQPCPRLHWHVGQSRAAPELLVLPLPCSKQCRRLQGASQDTFSLMV